MLLLGEGIEVGWVQGDSISHLYLSFTLNVQLVQMVLGRRPCPLFLRVGCFRLPQ
jgi:hypothetical protein